MGDSRLCASAGRFWVIGPPRSGMLAPMPGMTVQHPYSYSGSSLMHTCIKYTHVFMARK